MKEVLENQPTSELVVTETGEVKLPGNFEKLSEKKQKAVIITELQEAEHSFVSVITKQKDINERIKRLTYQLSQTKQMQELKALKKDVNEMTKLSNLMLIRVQGMLHLAKKLGFDVTAEMKNFKMITQ